MKRIGESLEEKISALREDLGNVKSDLNRLGDAVGWYGWGKASLRERINALCEYLGVNVVEQDQWHVVKKGE